MSLQWTIVPGRLRSELCPWGVKICYFQPVFRGKDAIINDMTDLYYVEDAYRLYNELDES